MKFTEQFLIVRMCNSKFRIGNKIDTKLGVMNNETVDVKSDENEKRIRL